MQLNFKKVGEGEPLVILHGLFGSLDNWLTLAKKLGDYFEVFIVDGRNHGQSPHSNEFNYDVMADDLYEFLMQNGIVDPIILGHSMGGKTAMQFAMNYPNKLKKLIVVDIAPKAYPVHHTEILDGMLSLDLEVINTRKEADKQLSNYISDISTRQFLLKNLHWITQGKLAWRFNLPVINNQIETIGQGLENIDPFEKSTLFIRGEKSTYITATDFKIINKIFPNSQIKTLNSGHWVHAEKPVEFLQLLNSFLLNS
ncbi:MAG: alpha/beta fold hydrolase [Flavobacteriales bacterium]|nr:alpha/beta fold hydrolase [Flavobacteriales bacterium]